MILTCPMCRKEFTINNIKNYSSKYIDDDCSICLDTLTDSVKLNCSHYFCKLCIKQYILHIYKNEYIQYNLYQYNNLIIIIIFFIISLFLICNDNIDSLAQYIDNNYFYSFRVLVLILCIYTIANFYLKIFN
jgi:hypothetical protein